MTGVRHGDQIIHHHRSMPASLLEPEIFNQLIQGGEGIFKLPAQNVLPSAAAHGLEWVKD